VLESNRHKSNVKLTKQKAKDIRQLYGWIPFTHKQLGELYGVHPATIGRLLRGETWQEVTAQG